MNKSSQKIVMLGAGGHASVLFDILCNNNETVHLIVTSRVQKTRSLFNGISIIDDNSFIKKYSPEEVILVNGIGMLPHSALRENIYTDYTKQGYQFKNIISEQSIVSPFALLDAGVQILPGTIIQAGAHIGENCIINTRAVIEHNCTIGPHNHIAPGAVLCGAVVTGKRTFIGAGSTVIQNIKIGDDVIIGAGTIITNDVTAKYIVHPQHQNHFRHRPL